MFEKQNSQSFIALIVFQRRIIKKIRRENSRLIVCCVMRYTLVRYSR